MRILKTQLLIILPLLWCMVCSAQQVRIEENFDGGWLFARYGLQPDGTRKPEPEFGTPQTLAFNDSKWRKLNLPHDWGIEGPLELIWMVTLENFPGGGLAGTASILKLHQRKKESSFI
jgi:hypothetical protein